MNGMYLHAIHASLLQQFRRLSERLHHFMNLILTHGSRWHLVRPAIWRFRRRRRNSIQIQHRLCEKAQHRIRIQLLHHRRNRKRPPESRRQLYKQLGPRLMEIHQPLSQVSIHLFILIQPLPKHRIQHRLASRQNQSHIILRHRLNKMRPHFIKMILLHPSQQIRSPHRCHHDAVLNRHLPNLPLCKQR